MKSDRLSVVAEVALLGAGACALFVSPLGPHRSTLFFLAAVGLLLAPLWRRGSLLGSDIGRMVMASGLCLLVWPVITSPTKPPILITPMVLIGIALLAIVLLGNQSWRRMTDSSTAAVLVSSGLIAISTLLFFALRGRYGLDTMFFWSTLVQAIIYMVTFTAATIVFRMRDGLILAVILLVGSYLPWIYL